ncbi:hypothetical protein [Methanococcus voltae]|uniref:Uncharacterized protein n=1 Tax=Methanococcus voltae (strain ATCC BAA-1334 / A3) TaxID=456320 RepID=D7DQQ2_METV3|nr:hypothetical protein [Methanococcus voltae]MCS3900839.1 lipopolysaccharide export LptBFGC system permease protein LptF [Methanococcus voltae]
MINNKNITIGLIIALVLTCVGAYWMGGHSGDGGGFLFDFLKNKNTTDNSTNNDTKNNTLINDTLINSTINQTTNNTINFITSAVFDNSTNNSVISIEASSENIIASQLTIFTSYTNDSFIEAYSSSDVSLPKVVTLAVNANNSNLYYYINVEYNNNTYRIPNGTEVIELNSNN